MSFVLCVSVCLRVLKNLADHNTDMFLLYNVALLKFYSYLGGGYSYSSK